MFFQKNKIKEKQKTKKKMSKIFRDHFFFDPWSFVSTSLSLFLKIKKEKKKKKKKKKKIASRVSEIN